MANNKQVKNLKSVIYKLEVVDANGIVRDYPVEAYELEAAINALSKKINVSTEEISLSKKGYKKKELEDWIWNNPFIKAKDTLDEGELLKRNKIARANADFKGFMRFIKEEEEHASYYDISPYKGNKNNVVSNREIKDRLWHSTTVNEKGELIPIGVDIIRKKDNKRHRVMVGAVNDILLEDLDNLIVRNINFIVPEKINNSTSQKAKDTIFRFPNWHAAYVHVRNMLLETGIENTMYNDTITYLEALDATLANTNIDMGKRRASSEVIAKFNKDYNYVKK